jgi:hypothetical protein
MDFTRDGRPRHSRMSALETDAVALLRDGKRTAIGMRNRLDARYYLIQLGWSVEEINAAQCAESEES